MLSQDEHILRLQYGAGEQLIVGDFGMGGFVDVFGSGLLRQQVHHEDPRMGAVLKLLRFDNPLGVEFPHFLRKFELIVPLLDLEQNRCI